MLVCSRIQNIDGYSWIPPAKFKIVIYKWKKLMYSNREQSRKPRVKCRPNGESRDGRRIYSAMRLPHPLLHIGTLPYVATILGRAKGRLFICPFPTVSIFVLLPDRLSGSFLRLYTDRNSAQSTFRTLDLGGILYTTTVIILNKTSVSTSMLTGLSIKMIKSAE